jgi:hypothetical protein
VVSHFKINLKAYQEGTPPLVKLEHGQLKIGLDVDLKCKLEEIELKK